MDLKEVLFDLCSVSAVSGFEESIAQKARDYLSGYTDEVKADAFGNISALVRAKKENAPTVMLDAHIDEVGLIVTALEEGGFVRFAPLGGVDPGILPASKVLIHGTKTIPAVVGVKPPHISSDGEELPKITELTADTGYSLESLEKIVSVGDPVSFASEPTELLNGFICAKSLDDRAGFAAILYALEKLRGKDLDVNLLISATVQEEIGLRGAKVAACSLSPDFCVVVDTSHGATPDAPPDKTYKMSGGAVIGLGPNLDKNAAKKLISLAKEKEIPYQLEVMGGNTGTNAWVIQVANGGVPCALLSVPLRYMHTKSEVVALSDLASTGDLLAAFIESCETGGGGELAWSY